MEEIVRHCLHVVAIRWDRIPEDSAVHTVGTAAALVIVIVFGAPIWFLFYLGCLVTWVSLSLYIVSRRLIAVFWLRYQVWSAIRRLRHNQED